MLTKTLLKTGLRDLTRRPLQTALMILGVALGVAVVIAIDLANTSAKTAFDLSTQAITGKTTHQIIGGSNGIDEDLYRQIRVDLGYRASAPLIEGTGIALDLDAQPFRILGVDFFAEAPFRSYLNESSSDAVDLIRFYTEPNTALIGKGIAERYGIKLNDVFRLQVNENILNIKVVGILSPREEGSKRALDGLMIMDIAGAQEVLGMKGKLSRVDLILDESQARRLQSALPANVRLALASEQANTVAQLTSAFQLNLTALSLLALIVGMFLIYNTMMFSVVQRRAVLGILRALGVTGAQLFALIVAEAAIASGIGALLGLGLGWVLGQGAVKLVTQTINDLYFSLNVSDTPLTLFTTIKGLALGIGAGVLAASAPALEAAGVEPVTAMRASSFEDRIKKWIPIIATIGVTFGIVGITVLLIFQSLILNFVSLFLIVIGLSLVVPFATDLLMRGVALLPFGLLNRLAARTVTKAISRTSVAIASLMVAVSVTIGVSVMIDSFRATVINWLDLTLQADVYVGAGGRVTSISSEVPKRLANVQGVDHIETFRATSVESEFGAINVSVIDARRQRAAKLYRFADGTPEQIWEQVMNGAVIVSEPFAVRHKLPIRGATITMHTDKGLRTFPVVAIYYDYSSDRGAVMMSQNVYHSYWEDRGITSVAVYVQKGIAPDDVADEIRAAVRGTALQVQVNRTLREQALTIFDRTFAITNALRILAVVVAFIGVLSALMALQIERTRELATMQAVGLTENQLWRLTLLETGLMGAVAGLLSLPTGFVLALVLIYVINLRSFGWTIQMQFDPSIFLQAMIVSVSAALLATVYPLKRLRKMEIAVGLRQE
jgi:putative ABC transport system permease protein